MPRQGMFWNGMLMLDLGLVCDASSGHVIEHMLMFPLG